MNKIMKLTISILFFLALILPASANGQAATAVPGWQADWNATLAAAKKEGKVVVYTMYGAKWRTAFSQAMSQKYGITVDVITATSSEVAERVMREQRTKTYIADVVIVGTSQFQLIFQPEGVLQSFEKALILPEVVNPKAWWTGELHWVDPDTKTYLQFYDYVVPSLVINTDLVKPEEVKSWKDLLNSKWKGRIVLNDPTVGGGSGQTLLTFFAYGVMDWDYVNGLLKQEPVLSRNNRLMTEWVARGKYPMVLGPHSETVSEFVKAGAPLKFMMPSEGTYLTAGSGNLSQTKGSPHPNAAKIFMNFLLTREGQTLSSNATGHQSARIDVATDHLAPVIVRQQGVKYFAKSDPEFMKMEVELKDKVVRLFKSLLK